MRNFIIRAWRSRLNLARTLVLRTVVFLARSYNFWQVSVVDQELAYRNVGLSRADGLAKLTRANEILTSSYDERHGMHSEHLLLLGSIAASNHPLERILEIGTYDGVTAVLLSRLFPNVPIDTIDLDSSDAEFIGSYGRGASAKEFAESRANTLSISENIRFFPCNSISIADWTSRYDLIWIDGAHGYPVVAMDVINAFRLSKVGGYVLVDDIWITGGAADRFYKSVGGFESLRELRSAGLIDDFHLIPKRLGGEFNVRWEKKYVGIFRRASAALPAT